MMAWERLGWYGCSQHRRGCERDEMHQLLLSVAGAALPLVTFLVARNAAVATGLALAANFAAACVARLSVGRRRTADRRWT